MTLGSREEQLVQRFMQYVQTHTDQFSLESMHDAGLDLDGELRRMYRLSFPVGGREYLCTLTRSTGGASFLVSEKNALEPLLVACGPSALRTFECVENMYFTKVRGGVKYLYRKELHDRALADLEHALAD